MSQHFLIDGHNLIFAESDLKTDFLKSQESGREKLIQRALSLHDEGSVSVTLVFDGQSAKTEWENPTGHDSFTLVQAAKHETADGVIERMIVRSKDPKILVVVTNDLSICNAAIASGCGIQSAESFFDETAGISASKQNRRNQKTSESWGTKIPL